MGPALQNNHGAKACASMKYSNYRSFEKHLEEAAPHHFASLYTLIDKDSFSRKAALDKLLEILLTGIGNRELCLKQLQGESLSIQEFSSELNSLAFFSERRIFLIHNCEKISKSLIEKLEPYFNHLPRQTYLILSFSTLASNTNLYKKLEKQGIILDIAEEKPWEKEKSLQTWLIAEAATQRKSIDPQASQILIKQIGADKALLQQELNKLICYVGERDSITLKDISAISTGIPSDNIWQLGEAIFKKEASEALRISRGILEEGAALLSLLRQIRTQFQTELEVGCILARGGNGEDVSRRFPYMKGGILNRHLQMAQSYGVAKLKEGILQIDAAELKAKNSASDPQLLSELLMIRLTS